jgi:oligopeptidase B
MPRVRRRVAVAPMKALLLLCLMIATVSLSAAEPPRLDPAAAKPPVAERKPKIVGLHGDKIEDPYFWLREKENPKLLEHLKAENAYTAAVMAPFQAFEDSLYREMLGRIKQTDVSAPYLQRGYWLYQRTEEGKQYPIYCRKKGSVDAPEEIISTSTSWRKGRSSCRSGRSSTATTTRCSPTRQTSTAIVTTIFS